MKYVCVFLITLPHSQVGGMTLPSNNFQEKFFFPISLLVCLCMCVRKTEKDRKINKTTQLCVKSWCKGNIKKSPGVGFQEASLCHRPAP